MRAAIAEHGDKIAVGLDVRGTTLAARGWTQEGGDLWETMARLDADGCARYVVTDVHRDGTLTGPNLQLLRDVCARTDAAVVASGGVSSLDDLRAIAALGDGRGRDRRQGALRGAFTLPEALAAVSSDLRTARILGPSDQDNDMSVAVRVIPCLDVDAGRVVKGVNFVGLRDAGDPVELARRYDEQGADELTFLDITASSGERETTYEVVRRTAEQVFIPLTVGGGVRTVGRRRCAAARRRRQGRREHRRDRPPGAARRDRASGSAGRCWCCRSTRAGPETESGFEVTTHGGRRGTGIDAVDWARRAAELGAGEILLNSMDADGTKDGYDLELIRLVRAAVTVPVIASGGAGKLADFAPAVQAGADAVLAASVFHFGDLTSARSRTRCARPTSWCAERSDARSPNRGRPRRPRRCPRSSTWATRCRPKATSASSTGSPVTVTRGSPRPTVTDACVGPGEPHGSGTTASSAGRRPAAAPRSPLTPLRGHGPRLPAGPARRTSSWWIRYSSRFSASRSGGNAKRRPDRRPGGERGDDLLVGVRGRVGVQMRAARRPAAARPAPARPAR